MFNRRNRMSSPPVVTRQSSSPNAAAIAAASAFQRSNIQPNLSAAAAAAALRARPHTPIDVSQVQTKRNLSKTRRHASISPMRLRREPTPVSMPQRPASTQHIRRGSSGSVAMSERRFRSPTPDSSIPPVPEIPKDVGRMTERDSAQGSWFGGAKVGDLDSVRKSDAIMQKAAPRKVTPTKATPPLTTPVSRQQQRVESVSPVRAMPGSLRKAPVTTHNRSETTQRRQPAPARRIKSPEPFVEDEPDSTLSTIDETQASLPSIEATAERPATMDAGSPAHTLPVSERFVQRHEQHEEAHEDSVDEDDARPPPTQTPKAIALRNSSVRSTHFADEHESLSVKHTPPPRATSPRKSALKQHSPAREHSPYDERADSAQEPQSSRRKSVRVSFDDANTKVVGQAAPQPQQNDSLVAPSPQTYKQKPWYSSLGRSKKSVTLDDDDEVMRPRPALPVFGSVRERMSSVSPQPEERPLMRPHDSPQVRPVSQTHGHLPAISEASSVSSDHAVGSVLQDQASKNAANISKFREPLPPVVTSVEGSGYISSESEDSDDAQEKQVHSATVPRLVNEPSAVSQTSTLVAENESKPEPMTKSAIVPHSGDSGDESDATERPSTPRASALTNKVLDVPPVPSILVTQPSPGFPSRRVRNIKDIVPGAFPETDVETEVEDNSRRNSLIIPQGRNSGDQSESESIYTDAYEDFEDRQLATFQSLDAVADISPSTTPTASNFPRAIMAPEVSHTKPIQQLEHSTATPDLSTQLTLVPATAPVPADDWAQAKAYWRSLTAEKRARLAKELEDEDGDAADIEETVTEVKKLKQKKSPAKRIAEKKAIEAIQASPPPPPPPNFGLKDDVAQKKPSPNTSQPTKVPTAPKPIQTAKAIEARRAVETPQPNLERSYMIRPGTQAQDDYVPSMKKSLRGPPPVSMPTPDNTPPKLRKSMRGEDNKVEQWLSDAEEPKITIRKTLRGSSGQRPLSYQAPPPATTTRTSITGHLRSRSETFSDSGVIEAAPGSAGPLRPAVPRHSSDMYTGSNVAAAAVAVATPAATTGGGSSSVSGGFKSLRLGKMRRRNSDSSGSSEESFRRARATRNAERSTSRGGFSGFRKSMRSNSVGSAGAPASVASSVTSATVRRSSFQPSGGVKRWPSVLREEDEGGLDRAVVVDEDEDEEELEGGSQVPSGVGGLDSSAVGGAGVSNGGSGNGNGNGNGDGNGKKKKRFGGLRKLFKLDD